MMRVITLTTDFGWRDAYVAAMKGSILSVNPHVTLVDISHSIAPQDIFEAAFTLHTVWRCFPGDSIHIMVVDPEVGGGRRALLLMTPHASFLAPDNGVLSYVLDDISEPPPSREAGVPRIPDDLRPLKLPSGAEAYVLSNPRLCRQPVSATFHGRDIFAPAAAHLSLGTPPGEFGEATDSVLVFPIPRPGSDEQGGCYGHVIHQDSFGNLITDIAAKDVPPGRVCVEVGSVAIYGLRPSYCEGCELLALIGSSGYLEVAARNGSAAQRLGLGVGDTVIVKKLQER